MADESARQFWADISQRAMTLQEKLRFREEVPAGIFWTAEEAGRFFKLRSAWYLRTTFKLDDANRSVFKLLCFYFSYDQRFYDLAAEMNIKNPDLRKGLLLASNVGVGKTLLMRICGANMRQSFRVKNAKEIANQYESGGMEAVEGYNHSGTCPHSFDNFYQPIQGLCLDDLGTEDIKSYMGNRKNVVGDIIEARYNKSHVGHLLHATTNLTPTELDSYYGPRVTSRLRQIVNLIELTGEDRRKIEQNTEELLRSFDISPFNNKMVK